MKRLRPIVLVVSALLSACLALLVGTRAAPARGPQGPGTSTGLRAPDEAGIRACVDQLLRGWNTGDADLFARPFAADADHVAISGMHGKGQKNLAEAHRRLFATVYKESTIGLSVKSIRALGPAHAVVHVAATNRFKQGGQMRDIAMTISLVVARIAGAGAWQIVAFHNTLVNPNPLD